MAVAGLQRRFRLVGVPIPRAAGGIATNAAGRGTQRKNLGGALTTMDAGARLWTLDGAGLPAKCGRLPGAPGGRGVIISGGVHCHPRPRAGWAPALVRGWTTPAE